MNLQLSKFQMDLAIAKAKYEVQRDEDRKMFGLIELAMLEPCIEVKEERRLLLLGDLNMFLWEKNTKLADNVVIGLRVANIMEDSRRWKVWADVETGTWPVFFHPYSMLVYHEEQA